MKTEIEIVYPSDEVLRLIVQISERAQEIESELSRSGRGPKQDERLRLARQANQIQVELRTLRMRLVGELK